ncbi:hypothetical protein RIEGSTA812A_PEG_1285 [invertebrate metagenome]|uniref:Uncharacterized protein n=1 Tax=invertebrate metagenome TaxID=1711999 RepID=A0A484HDA2_9ZZZZ
MVLSEWSSASLALPPFHPHNLNDEAMTMQLVGDNEKLEGAFSQSTLRQTSAGM